MESFYFFQAKSCSEIQRLTSPFVDEMYELLNATLVEYDIIIRRWPEYAASLEKVSNRVQNEKSLILSIPISLHFTIT